MPPVPMQPVSSMTVLTVVLMMWPVVVTQAPQKMFWMTVHPITTTTIKIIKDTTTRIIIVVTMDLHITVCQHMLRLKKRFFAFGGDSGGKSLK